MNPDDHLHPADLTDAAAVRRAVEGSEVVYVTVGFPYSKKVWKETWPPFMKSVIDACKAEGCKLVFFDNIYMYDPDHLDGMTEETPIRPCSEKGKVRTQVVNMITDAIDRGELKALIARSADFYGPSISTTSVLTETVFKPLSQGKKANWLGSVDFKHSYTYTPDAGKATALLGNTEDAYGQVWHLPTAPNPFTGKEWIEAIAKEMGAKPNYQVAPKFLVKVMGLFMPLMRELVEMMYQNDRDYVFDSSKFEKRFTISATPYLEGIKAVVDTDYRKK